MSLFDKKSRIEKLLSESEIGLWRVEYEAGKEPRMYADPKMLELMGAGEDLTPEQLFEFQNSCVAEEDRDVFDEYGNEILSSGRAELVYGYVHPTKGNRIIRCGGVREESADGCIYLAGTHQDITETIRIERERAVESSLKKENLELRRDRNFTNNFFNKLIKLQICGIVAYRFPSREIVIINDTAKKLYGLPIDRELDKETIRDFAKRIEYDNGKETLLKLKELRKPGDKLNFSMWVTHKDGSKKHIHVNTMITQFEEGERMIISSLLDISSLTQVREDNAKLEQQLEIINSLSNIFDLIYYIDAQKQTFLEVDTRGTELHDALGVEGNLWNMIRIIRSEFVPEKYWTKFDAFFELNSIDERLRDRDWISIQLENTVSGWIELYLIAAKRDETGKCVRLILASHNIDEAKRKELSYREALETTTLEAKAASEAKSRFLLTMSHDVRTPMNAIIGFIDLMEKYREDNTRFYANFTKAKRSCDFLLSLINNVLEMTRIESGRATLDESVYDTTMIFRDIYDVFDELMSSKNIRFIRDVECHTRYIMCDETKLKEIYLNLLSNAYKYTPEGGTITMQLRELPAEKSGYIMIKAVISDTGIGMSREFLPHVFEQFSRENSFTDSKIEGTGLGMPIVKALVELMGGTITVESELGKGTSFTIEICHKVADNAGNDKDGENGFSEDIFKGKRILLAEDNELNAEIASEILKSKGFFVDWAKDGIDCVDKLQKSPDGYYDLILMDIQMPNMDGYKATGIIRDMDCLQKKNIPIVAMTANAFEEDRKNALDAGMNGHLAKPISVKKLTEILVNILMEA